MRKVTIITDMQFGSTGKGLLAGFLATHRGFDTVITAWGPNAGHTFIDADGKKYVHTMLANGIVSPRLKRVMIGPGSVLNPDALLAECAAANFPLDKILIHEHAAIVTEYHRYKEGGYGHKIGSTMKGTAEAVMQKLRRDPDDMNTAKALLAAWPELLPCLASHDRWQNTIYEADHALIEGAQGYSLSINHGFYPYTTSRDCTTLQILSDCGMPWPYYEVEVWGSCRTYPIRVANRFNKDGEQIGTSGPCYFDQRELTWEEVGQPVELTTVTKLPRRVFSFSSQQVEEAIVINGIRNVFLNFCNYLQSHDELDSLIGTIEGAGAKVQLLGWGPTINDVRPSHDAQLHFPLR